MDYVVRASLFHRFMSGKGRSMQRGAALRISFVIHGMGAKIAASISQIIKMTRDRSSTILNNGYPCEMTFYIESSIMC